MDNYTFVINGVILAAKILDICVPNVEFLNEENLPERLMNSIFLKEEYTIVFNKEWIKQTNPIEIQITCFHETRHAFQWKCITGEYSKINEINPFIIKKWKNEMIDYIQPTGCTNIDFEYLNQDIEIDAIAFSHYQMNKIFDINSTIPKVIAKKVYEKINEFEMLDL